MDLSQRRSRRACPCDDGVPRKRSTAGTLARSGSQFFTEGGLANLSSDAREYCRSDSKSAQMIVTLKSWTEIGEANKEWARAGLPRHETPEKNWDLVLLKRCLEGLKSDATIVDLGCGDCYGLKYLAALGFTNLIGIDLTISLRSRASAWKRQVTGKPSFTLRRADILATGLR